MSEWVHRTELARVIREHWPRFDIRYPTETGVTQLARQTGIPDRTLRRTLNDGEGFTSYGIAERVLTALGLNISDELEIIERPRPNRVHRKA